MGLQANVPQPNEDDDGDDDVDAALTDLQISLEGGNANGIDIVTVPTLSDTLRYLRPKKFTLKGYKRHHFVLRELQLSAYRTEEDSMDMSQPASFTVNLKGCEITPDVNIASRKYGIKLAVPSQDGMSDLWIKCENVRLSASMMMTSFN